MLLRGSKLWAGCMAGVAFIAIAFLAGEARADEPSRAARSRNAPALAAPAAREAQRRFELGVKAFEEGHFDTAYDEFETAYATWPRTTFILAMARAQLRMGNTEKARMLLQLCLTASPDDEETRARLAELDAHIGLGDSLGDSGAASTNPLPAPSPPPPLADETSLLGVTQPAPQAAPVPTPWYRRWWVWGAGAAVLAGASAAIAISVSRPDYSDRGSLGHLGVPDR